MFGGRFWICLCQLYNLYLETTCCKWFITLFCFFRLDRICLILFWTALLYLLLTAFLWSLLLKAASKRTKLLVVRFYNVLVSSFFDRLRIFLTVNLKKKKKKSDANWNDNGVIHKVRTLRIRIFRPLPCGTCTCTFSLHLLAPTTSVQILFFKEDMTEIDLVNSYESKNH